MKKEGKISLVYLQISIMIISVFSFSFILNMGVVFGAENIENNYFQDGEDYYRVTRYPSDRYGRVFQSTPEGGWRQTKINPDYAESMYKPISENNLPDNLKWGAITNIESRGTQALVPTPTREPGTPIRAVSSGQTVLYNNQVYTVKSSKEGIHELLSLDGKNTISNVPTASLTAASGDGKLVDINDIFYNRAGQNYDVLQAQRFEDGSYRLLLKDGKEMILDETNIKNVYTGKDGFSGESFGEVYSQSATPQEPSGISKGLERLKGLLGDFNIIESAIQAGVIGGIAMLVMGMVKEGDNNAQQAGFFAGAVGSLVHDVARDIFKSDIPILNAGVGIAAGVIVFSLLYEEYDEDSLTFECVPFEAPIGENAKCEECNKDPLRPCSEYRCKSLGQACELLNPGTGEEQCAWVNPRDVNQMTIEVNEEVLTREHRYVNPKKSPPGWGTGIERTDQKCLKAFTPLQFGIITSEPVQCKMDYIRPTPGNGTTKDMFDSLKFWFGGSTLYRYNHTQILSLPGPKNIEYEAPELMNDGIYSLFVMCKNANDRVNENVYAVNFCVDEGPDVTPPMIQGYSLPDRSPIKFNTTLIELEVYVNEPADCKWSYLDRDFDNMEYNMSCSKSVLEMNANMIYKCNVELFGLKSNVDNKFYFRCKDNPLASEGDRNVNKESFVYTLRGTQELGIVNVEPNETIKDSTDYVKVDLKVETFGGEDKGKASCFFSTTGSEGSYIKFFKTESNLHEQRQDLPEGKYTYYFKCVDLGGNTDYSQTSFEIDVDNDAPKVVRSFNINNELKIITDEKANCVYDTVSCEFEFETGLSMPYTLSTDHTADWMKDKTYYIKCEDEYGNRPSPTQCSIVVRMYDEV